MGKNDDLEIEKEKVYFAEPSVQGDSYKMS